MLNSSGDNARLQAMVSEAACLPSPRFLLPLLFFFSFFPSASRVPNYQSYFPTRNRLPKLGRLLVASHGFSHLRHGPENFFSRRQKLVPQAGLA